MSTATALAEIGGNGFSSAQIAATLSNRFQQLILLPTEKCNFRCTYCYEDFALGRMSEATVSGIERFLDHRVPELSHLSLSWFGGEPLVAKNIVLRIASYAHRLCERSGTTLSGGLTTNGFLLNRALLEELVSFRQNFFQITLDGLGDTHDAVRKRASGKGSFDRIWANLIDAKSVTDYFHIQLRIHVRRDSIDELPLLMRELASNFGSDRRFTLEFEHLRDLGGDGGKTIKSPVTRAELAAIEEGCREIYRAHADPAAGSLQGAGDEPSSPVSKFGTPIESHYICYAAKANSLLIRSDGRIGKCTVALNDDRNTIGRIREDGTIELDNVKLGPWLRGLDTLDPATLACPLSGLPGRAAP